MAYAPDVLCHNAHMQPSGGHRRTTVEDGRRTLTESRRLGGTPGELVLSARMLFELQGVAQTSVKQVAAESGVARELVYYHFGDKDGLIAAVVDDYVEDVVESVIVWNESRRFGDTAGSLRECVVTFRRTMYDSSGPRPMIRVLEELGARDAFLVRSVQEAASCVTDNLVEDYRRYHPVEIEHVFEMFCTAMFGVVGLLKMDPDIPDTTLMKVIEQTLHLDIHPIAPEPES